MVKIISSKINILIRLTGKPLIEDWPDCSVELDQFLMTIPCEPRQLLPRLCDYANDLLKVRILFEYYTWKF